MLTENFFLNLVKSFGLHLFIGVGLVVSVAFKSDHTPIPEVIQVEPIVAVSVDQDKLATQINRIKTEKANQQKAEEKRVQDLEDRAKNAAVKRAQEEDNIRDLNKKTRESQAEKRKAEAEAKKAQEKQERERTLAEQAAAETAKKLTEKANAEKAAEDAKARRIKEEQAAAQAEADRKAKAQREKEEKVRKAKEARERLEQEAVLQQQMAEEQAARDKIYQQKVLGEVEKYKALIKQAIDQNIFRDESMRGKSCRVNVKLAFNGLVTSVKIIDGDPIVCKATETAIYKAGQLPMSKDTNAIEQLKDLTINYIPDFR